MSTYCFLGLGNPGPEYTLTRHNIGFRLADLIAGDTVFKIKKNIAAWTTLEFEDAKIIIAKPLTFMNNSGMAACFLLEKFYLAPKDLILGFDDFNISFGKIRIRKEGSSGGHNGVQSVLDLLGTKEIKRIRFGVGREEASRDADFVLSGFSQEEEKEIPPILERSREAFFDIIKNNIDYAMNKYNK